MASQARPFMSRPTVEQGRTGEPWRCAEACSVVPQVYRPLELLRIDVRRWLAANPTPSIRLPATPLLRNPEEPLVGVTQA